ncbi:MAG TPA: hypothetical protein VED37_01880, partial [Ktedonobacteraceae bacterium]|nr:hypothetical protein [Ktedonobacteraceae bacterium]
MSFSVFLKPAYVLQTIMLALSIFNLVAFLWLAATVWLNGDRKSGIARLGVVGLSLSALFFFIHALLISGPLTQSSGLVSTEFLWHLIWLPALGVPYIWFAIGLYYAAMINPGWRKRRPYFLALCGIFGFIILVLLIMNQSTFSYEGTLRLIAYNNTLNDLDAEHFSPMVLMPVLFLFYVTFCAIGPWFTVGRISRLLRVIWMYTVSIPERLRKSRSPADNHTEGPSLHQALIDAFWDDPTDVELLEEPYLSWHLARPGLLLAALLMAALTTTLGILVVQSTANWIQYGHRIVSSIPPQPLPSGILLVDTFPLNLILLDLAATFAVALVILLIGYSVVRHGILIERSLARRGFFKQWRGIVIVSTAVAIFIAILVSVTHSNLAGLLLITSLAAVTYALFTWSSYTDHDRYIALLGPFVRSTSLSHWLNTDLQKTEQDLGNLFFHLCHDVLAVQFAYLTVAAGTLKRNFSYRWPKDTVLGSKLVALDKKGNIDVEAPKRIQITLHGRRMICWVLPIFDERGLVAALYLGPREDGGAFTDEDMDLAQACGQRILDTLGDHEAMQAVAGLL